MPRRGNLQHNIPVIWVPINMEHLGFSMLSRLYAYHSI